MTRSSLAPLAHRPVPVRTLPAYLSVAWLVVAPMYLLLPAWVPEPAIGLLVSTTVGVLGWLLMAVSQRRVIPIRGDSAVGDDGRITTRSQSGGASLPQYRGDGGRAPMPSRPVGTSGQRVGTPPLAARSQMTLAVSTTTRHGEDLDPSKPDPLDLARYEAADFQELQCPRCGSLGPLADPRDASRGSCPTCQHRWRLDSATPPPDVVVRSWLHPKE